MDFKPYDYQKFAIDFIKKNKIAALFLTMGLGKTVITLTALWNLIFECFEVSRVLIVAPIRVAVNTWPDEIRKWKHLDGLSFSVVVGTQKQRKAALQKDVNIYIINRENLDWLTKNDQCNFDMVIVDELSSFANYQCLRFKALMKIRAKVSRIVGLTGTPGDLMKLWAELKVLDFGERLGRYITQYRNKYFVPDKRNGMVVYSYKPIEGSEQKIYDAISDITVSMRACDYLKLPELISNRYMVKMSEKEQLQYDAMKKEMVLELGDETITALNAASLSSKLMQMSNGAVYGTDKTVKIHDRKLDALEDMLESADGNPVLVVYWFKHDRIRIIERLQKIGLGYENIKSEQSIRDWNNGRIAVGLIHPASAGHGLNLQYSNASTIIWFSLTYSLELYQQCNSRLARNGNNAKVIVIEHIVTEGSIDEQILKVLENKESTQDRLIDAVKAQLEVK